MDYLIRSATAQDVAAITRLERESSTAAHWTERQYESRLGDPSLSERLILVAWLETSTAILGFLVARHVSREWELENIVVASEAHRRGIGTALLAELLSHAHAGDAVFLEVRESNSAARGLYAKLGFEESGRRRAYYSNPPEDAVLYRKTMQDRTISG